MTKNTIKITNIYQLDKFMHDIEYLIPWFDNDSNNRIVEYVLKNGENGRAMIVGSYLSSIFDKML